MVIKHRLGLEKKFLKNFWVKSQKIAEKLEENLRKFFEPPKKLNFIESFQNLEKI